MVLSHIHNHLSGLLLFTLVHSSDDNVTVSCDSLYELSRSLVLRLNLTTVNVTCPEDEEEEEEEEEEEVVDSSDSRTDPAKGTYHPLSHAIMTVRGGWKRSRVHI